MKYMYRKVDIHNRFVAVCICFAFIASHAQAAEKALQIPGSLKGKEYKTARSKILASGWRPDYRSADWEWIRDLQKQYPELRYCAVDRPVCSLHFVGKNGACLKVIVTGESSQEYRVYDVARECDKTQ